MTEGSPGFERLLTPSKITAWLDCGHYLTLKHQVEGGARPRPDQAFGLFAQLLMDKGLAHEAAVLESYRARGLRVVEVEDRDKASKESFAAWAERSAPLLESDADVLFQMPLVHDGIRGIADFLERVVDSDGVVRWEPVDAKLARKAAKPGHVLQLCFYAEAIEALTGVTPRDLKVSLGSGRTDTVRFAEVRPYWTRLRSQVRTAIDAGPDDTPTQPEPCDHCDFCEFAIECEQTWREADSLIYVAGIRSTDRAALETGAVDTLASLAQRTTEVADLRDDRLTRLRTQASLQVEARDAQGAAKPPFLLIEASDDDPVWGHGFEQLPEPDPADIFLDFEGHPFWRADRGLFFLFGYIAADETDVWSIHQLWAHDEAAEAAKVEELIEYIASRRAEHPGMHVYHYNHTERSSLVALTAEYGVAEGTLAKLIDEGVFVDLFLVARNAVQVGAEGYGLKYLEQLTDYERSHDIDKGAGAVVAFEEYGATGDRMLLDAIAAYNQDDVRATKALRDWLVDQRPIELDWRSDPESEDRYADVDALTAQLAAFEEGTPQHHLADLLGYWIREWQAYIAPIIGKLTNDTADHRDDRTVLTRLTAVGEVDRLTPTGKPAKWPGLRLTFPPQPLDRGFRDVRPGRPHKVIYLGADGMVAFATVDSIDVERGTVVLVWDDKAKEHGIPGSVVLDDWVGPSSKLDALNRLVGQVLDPATNGAPNPVTLALLQANAPSFHPGGGPADGRFSDDKNDLARWVTELDESVLAVQGPPGTGKTYRGAHMAKELVAAGKRVGIMAMSHNAIDNFLAEIVEVFAGDPAVELRASRNRSEPEGGGLAGVTYVSSNKALADPKYNVVCGTAWTFAGKDLLDHPVDVLLIDEAGQLALIDAVVASMAAGSVVLLGDPMQLPQVAMASHPGSSGHSALGHVLGDRDTIEDRFGVFITETRRMHPDVCRFISDRIYEGRLSSYIDCANQATELGTGLRWLKVEHAGCSTESVEEAEAVAAQVRALLGRGWTDKTGAERVIGVDDIMVVAPYNDQVRLLREHLDADPDTGGVAVGTVDKFQGRQAPVVLFTMTSSSAEDMPRGTEFLFSKNRLNVAVSRAQCLAYLVCTEQLLNSRARTVEDMHLIATLCAFVEYAEAA